MIRSTSCIHSGAIGTRLIPRASRRLRMNGSVIVKREPSSATRVRPSATSRSAAASPMWSTGTRTWRGDRLIGFVDGVAGDDDAFGAALLEPLGGVHHDLGDAVPVAGELHRGDLREIEALDRQRRAVQAAEALRDAAIDMFVIKRGRRPAHAPDDAQLAQRSTPSRLMPDDPPTRVVPISDMFATASGKRVTAEFTSELNRFAPSRCNHLRADRARKGRR